MDHRRALGQAQYRRTPDALHGELGLGVGGHDGLGCQHLCFSALAGRRPSLDSRLADPRLDLVHGQRHANDAGGHDQGRAGCQAERALYHFGHT